MKNKENIKKEKPNTQPKKTSSSSFVKGVIFGLIFGLISMIIIIAFVFWVSKTTSRHLDTEEPMPYEMYDKGEPAVYKPVIYLYPTKKQQVEVKLFYKGEIFADYPEYDKKLNGWSVTAYPDGKIVNNKDGVEYSYLFWEGKSDEKTNWDLSKGFIVKGSDTKEFLQEKLAEIGLTPKEYNEFIVYWFPKMQGNKYNLIHFAGKKYTDSAKLSITPKPDSVLRVFMVFKALDDKNIAVEPQKFQKFDRKGFSVVEWGGSEVE